MRDKNRIEPFLSELGKYWKKVPDWRFGQLMVNIFSQYKYDPFYLEEKEMIELIRKCFNETEGEEQEKVNEHNKSV